MDALGEVVDGLVGPLKNVAVGMTIYNAGWWC